MTREEEKLRSINDNAQLALDFLKKCQKCRESGVPNDMAILAALHDLADWKDQHPSVDTVKKIVCYALKYTNIMLEDDLENGVEWELLIKKAMEE